MFVFMVEQPKCVMYGWCTFDVGDQIFLAEAPVVLCCFFAPPRLLWNHLSLSLSLSLPMYLSYSPRDKGMQSDDHKRGHGVHIIDIPQMPKSHPNRAKFILWPREDSQHKFCMSMHQTQIRLKTKESNRHCTLDPSPSGVRTLSSAACKMSIYRKCVSCLWCMPSLPPFIRRTCPSLSNVLHNTAVSVRRNGKLSYPSSIRDHRNLASLGQASIGEDKREITGQVASQEVPKFG